MDSVALRAPRRARRRQRCHRLVRRQREGRQLLGIVGPPEDIRPVRIAVLEGHEHLPADARDQHRSRRIGLHHAHGEAALVVRRSLTIPEEADVDVPLLVRVDLLARRAGDDGGVDPRDLRPRCDDRKAIGDLARNGSDAEGEPRTLLAPGVLDRDDEELALGARRPDVVADGGERDREPRRERGRACLELVLLGVRAKALEQHARPVRALVGRLEPSGRAVHLGRLLDVEAGIRHAFERERGLGGIVVAQRHLARATAAR